jgi:hypothetical protein
VFLSFLVLSASNGFSLNTPPTLTPEEVVEKAVTRAQWSRKANQRKHYTYTKLSIMEELDGKGQVTERKEKLFAFQSGLASLKYVKINGQTLSAADRKKQEQTSVHNRQQLTDSKSTSKDDNWERYLTSELVAKYQFALVERATLNGRPTYVLSFQPRTESLAVKKMADRLLNQLAGKVWIDEEEFEIARAEIDLQSKVTLGGGLMEVLGSLKKFSFILERIRLEEGVWFNLLTQGDFEGRKLFDSTHQKLRTESGNFQRIVPRFQNRTSVP